MFDYLSLNQKEFPVASSQFEHPGMNRDYFDLLTDNFRSPHLWYKNGSSWNLRKPVWR